MEDYFESNKELDKQTVGTVEEARERIEDFENYLDGFELQEDERQALRETFMMSQIYLFVQAGLFDREEFIALLKKTNFI
jgi:hypothetical protein